MNNFETLDDLFVTYGRQQQGQYVGQYERLSNLRSEFKRTLDRIEAHVRELETSKAMADAALEQSSKLLRRQTARVEELEGFQTQYAVLRQENERLRETLREIYDCADDWNRVEDLASEALGEQKPAT